MVTPTLVRLAIGSLASLYKMELTAGSKPPGYHDLAKILETIEPALDNPAELTQSEREFLDLADETVDALWHGFDKVAKLPTSAARSLLETAAIAILEGRAYDAEGIRNYSAV